METPICPSTPPPPPPPSTRSFNPFSGFMNATYILKSKKVPDIDTVIKVLEVS